MPSDSEIMQCPAEGCDYEGLATSVASHYQAKTDGAHPGSRQKALRLLEQDMATSDTEAVQEQSSEQSTGTASSNPVFGSADPNAEPTREQSSEQSTGDTKKGEKLCPSCKGALWDFRQYETGAYHAVNGNQVYVRGDFQCAECGKWWVDE